MQKLTLGTLIAFIFSIIIFSTTRFVVRAQDSSASSSLEPTVTIEPTIISEPTATPEPTITLAPSATPMIELTPTATPTPSPINTPTPSATPTPSIEEVSIPQRPQTITKLQSQRSKLVPMYVPGEVLVKFKSNRLNLVTTAGKDRAQDLAQARNLSVEDQSPTDNITLFRSRSAGRSVEDLIAELQKDDTVEYAQPNYIYQTQDVGTNDTYTNELWGLKNVGQTVNGVVGTNNADIDGSEGWALSEGSGVIVAVIDSGVLYTHPDLQNNMWDGSACVSDTNAYMGNCTHGYDYLDNDKTPLPTTSDHGTHVAGTIAAIKNNSIGVAGVAPSAKIMAIKTDLTSLGNIKSVNFARYNGAQVINASWGGYGNDTALKAAIDGFSGLFVTAAGNGGADGIGDNNDSLLFYPCSFTSANIICVAASTQSDGLASFSNYGSTHVDIAAPGFNIISTGLNSTLYNSLDTNFNYLTPPYLPSAWSQTANWGSYSFSGDVVIYGDVVNVPYAANANSTMTTGTHALSGYDSAKIEFYTQCDNEYDTSNWSDYMALELTSDGSNYTQVLRWDEVYLDGDASSIGSAADTLTYDIPSQYYTSNFRMRFRWVTDSSDSGGGDGCFIDDIKLTGYTNTPTYKYMDGTSMATPHVVGAVADMISEYPSYSTSDIKSAVINYSDTISGLSGITVSGKRLNLNKALIKSYLADRVGTFGVYRFYRPNVDIHFYSASQSEIFSILDNDVNNTWNFEGFAYRAMNSPASERVPLYRFYRTDAGVHFYTASETEKDSIINNPNATTWSYEGIAYYVFPSNYQGSSTSAYRFYRTDAGVHFYTASETEKDSIINNPYAITWSYEGVSYKLPIN